MPLRRQRPPRALLPSPGALRRERRVLLQMRDEQPPRPGRAHPRDVSPEPLQRRARPGALYRARRARPTSRRARGRACAPRRTGRRSAGASAAPRSRRSRASAPAAGESCGAADGARAGARDVNDDACTRCGAALAPGQEYCVECGQRQCRSAGGRCTGCGRLRRRPSSPRRGCGGDRRRRRRRRRLHDRRADAAAGRTGARERSRGEAPELAALGAAVTRSCSRSFPSTAGPEAARTRALWRPPPRACPTSACSTRRATRSLHPGYWIVFSGVYRTLDEALAALPQSRPPRPQRVCAADHPLTSRGGLCNTSEQDFVTARKTR